VKSYKELIQESANTSILSANQMTIRDKLIFKKILDSTKDFSQSYNLPKEIEAMGKPELLKLIYRLIQMVKE
jgi:hypothetical protein